MNNYFRYIFKKRVYKKLPKLRASQFVAPNIIPTKGIKMIANSKPFKPQTGASLKYIGKTWKSDKTPANKAKGIIQNMYAKNNFLNENILLQLM